METREYEIDLREYFQIIRKRIWIILLLTVISIAVSAIISYFVLVPVYETSTTLIVSKPNEQKSIIQYSDVLLSQQLVKTYGEIIKSRNISNQVIENLKLKKTLEKFKKNVEVSPVRDTEIVQIEVKDTDPELAKDIANELAAVFMKDIKRIMRVDNVQVVDKAETPLKPISPRLYLNIVIAGFLGIMMGLGIVFLVEYLDNTIKTPIDIEKYLDLPVIGIIPDTDRRMDKKIRKA